MINKAPAMIKLFILKLKNLKYPAFRTDSLRTQESHSHVKSYFITLFLIGSAVSLFYYFYLKYCGGFYFVHYYEYYTRAVVITDSLMKLDFLSAVRYGLGSYVDKIMILRSIPFLLLFGPSQFVFFYSNVFFNLFLLLILFHSLLKIMQPEKAFYLTLFILSQYFFTELLASFYVDLSFFLLCSIFFIYLSLFDKNPEKYNIRLMFIVFLLFLIKNVSYPLVPIVSILFIIYFFISKNKRMSYVLRFSIIVTAGFLIYYIVALRGSNQRLIEELRGSSMVSFNGSENLITTLRNIFRSFGFPKNNFSVINKFPFFWFNLIIYQVVIFIAYKKRDAFWIFLFFVSEFFFFFFYNVKGHYHDYRYFLPFYFIYLYFVYEFLIILFNKIFAKRWPIAFLLLFLMFFLAGLLRLKDPKVRMDYAGNYNEADYFSSYFPLRSKVYMVDIPDYFHLYGSFIDREEKDYSYLAKVDSRFKYKIVESFENADYVIGKGPLKPDHKECELITTVDGYYLLKMK